MSKRIGIIVDHPVRDLGGCVLIANSLKEIDSSVEVFLIPMAQQEYEVFSLRIEYVVLNYIRKNNVNFIRKLISANIQFGLMDTEGGFYGNLQDYKDLLPEASDIYEHLQGNFLWGEKMLEVWSSYAPKAMNIVTGLPRFDFYDSKFKGFEDNFLPEKYQVKNNLILINTKVSLANPKFISLENEIKLYRTLGISEEAIERHLTMGKKSIEGNVQLVKSLEEVEDLSVILRPHPHENNKTYEEKFSQNQITKAEVVQQGNISPWIAKSSMVLHRHCTTAIEAVIAGKPAISTMWIPTSSNAPDAEKISYKCESPEELVDLVKETIRNSEFKNQLLPDSNTREEVINRWLYKMDGLSCKRVAEAILNSFNSNLELNERKARDILYSNFNSKEGMKAKLYNSIWLMGKYNLGRSLLWDLERKRFAKWMNTSKGISLSETNQWLKTVDNKKLFSQVSSVHSLDGYPACSLYLN